MNNSLATGSCVPPAATASEAPVSYAADIAEDIVPQLSPDDTPEVMYEAFKLVKHHLKCWIDYAAMESRNTAYYKSLVVECGEAIGVEAYTQDDGGTVPDVLCAKVPELVRTLLLSNEQLVNCFNRMSSALIVYADPESVYEEPEKLARETLAEVMNVAAAQEAQQGNRTMEVPEWSANPAIPFSNIYVQQVYSLMNDDKQPPKGHHWEGWMARRIVDLFKPTVGLALAADVCATGLPVTQEPKYTVSGSFITNRVSGEAIPHDEPMFIFRARDIHAVDTLKYYAQEVQDIDHKVAVLSRCKDFEQFRNENPDRMKYPDTETFKKD